MDTRKKIPSMKKTITVEARICINLTMKMITQTRTMTFMNESFRRSFRFD